MATSQRKAGGPIKIDQFRGIVPRMGATVPIPYAETAENVALESLKIRPMDGHSLEQADTNGYNSLIYFNNQWLLGDGRFFLPWAIDGIEHLYYLDSGVLMRRIGSTVCRASQENPGIPTTALNGAGNVGRGATTTFTGGGLNDLTANTSGTTLGLDAGMVYEIEIAATGTPDNFRWRKQIPGATEWGGWSPQINMTGGAQAIDDGVTVTFAAATGHTLGNKWTVTLYTDTVRHFITTVRTVEGVTDESGPSGPSTALAVAKNIVRVTRPTISDAQVTAWRVYRMSTFTSEYLLVAEVAATATYYDDNIADADLGAAPGVWYQSTMGSEILYAPAPEGLEGLVNEPYKGMIFGWIGPTLYWCDPGAPGGWNAIYSMNFPANIKRVLSFAGSMAVLTAAGPFRVDGEHPELLSPSKQIATEPAMTSAACITSKGIIYLTDGGLALFDLVGGGSVSNRAFTREWFQDNIVNEGTVLIDAGEILYLFHGSGTLYLDQRGASKQFVPTWQTLDLVASAAWKDDDSGTVYFIDAAGVKSMNSDDANPLTWTWKSGEITNGSKKETRFEQVEVFGAGAVTLTLYLDGVQAASKALDFGSGLDRDRSLKFPDGLWGEAMQFKLTGTGQIDEVLIEVAG